MLVRLDLRRQIGIARAGQFGQTMPPSGRLLAVAALSPSLTDRRPSRDNGRMGDRPKLLCPQCGANLHGCPTEACPACGYYIGIARVHHRGALRYWRFLRKRRWIEAISALLWLGAFGFGCWLTTFLPKTALVVLTALTGLGVVGVGKYLRFRRKKKQ